jgi:uncharacterized membrane protein YhhN
VTALLPVAASVLCAVFLALHIASEHQGQKALGALSKVLASASFLGVAWTLGAWSSVYGKLVLGALAFCAIGDVLLLSRAAPAFLGGLASFLLGHVLLAVGFASLGLQRGWLPGALLVLGAIGGRVLFWLMPHVEKRMKIPVLAYCGAISVMVGLAVAAFGRGAHWVVPVGAVLFYASDLSVARDRFVKTAFINRLWGLPAYYASTVLIAWSVRGH